MLRNYSSKKSTNAKSPAIARTQNERVSSSSWSVKIMNINSIDVGR